ncbi:HAD family hydrolase [Streptomyces sp. H27-D2]|uniref:HAD family hydrolase n=1 Tax=Streptomyces sp. H27-D2 TaxID=3046304 RepID=UPI002DBA87F1|nr:HAD family hydrolase [Streptomyces sp. H27-D2]MEC4015686.1 HAD family hydrolase [Streptomyces sp. H27-D2]
MKTSSEETNAIHAARHLIESAKCILFDFDGPICHLFAGYPASEIADSLRDWLHERTPPTTALPDSQDPQRLLTGVAELISPRLFAELEQELTRHELRATRTARATPGALPLIQQLAASGHGLAIATNNSRHAVEQYLRRENLARPFGAHIHGRGQLPHELKPHPSCLLHALESTHTHPGAALMIGDSDADVAAANAAHVAFLGYAKDERRFLRLRNAGATDVIRSLEPLSGG